MHPKQNLAAVSYLVLATGVVVILLLAAANRAEAAEAQPAGASAPQEGGLSEKERGILSRLEKLTKSETLTVEGRLFFRYWYDINNEEIEEGDEPEVRQNSFELWRAYFGVSSRIVKWLTLRFTADVGPEKKGVKTTKAEDGHYHTKAEDDHYHKVDGDQSYQFFVKFAWLNVELLKDLHLRAGVIENPYHEFIDGFWGYRFVLKNVGDEEDIYDSADVGAYLRYKAPRDLGSLLVGVVNGGGYKKALDPNTNKTLWVLLTVSPLATLREYLKKLTFMGFVQYPMITAESLDRELLLGAFAGFSSSWVTVGYQPLWTYTRKAAGDSDSRLGHGAYLRVDTPIKLGLLSRFGAWYYEDKKTGAVRPKYNFLAGLGYSPAKFLSVAASFFVGWKPEDDDPETEEAENELRFLLSTELRY